MSSVDTFGTLRARWGTFLHNRQLGIAWVCAALFGAVVISASYELDVKRFCLPVLVMVLYVVVAFNRAQVVFKTTAASSSYQHALVSQMADSVYFLGFLWTLWALIDSFVLKASTTSTSVFRTFGYALVTTSCGTFLRLAILQFRFTAIDQGAEAEVSIEEKLQHFGATLTETGVLLNGWNSTLANTSQSFRRIDGEVQAALNHIVEQSRDAVVAVVEHHKRLVDSTVRESNASIERVTAVLAQRIESAVSGSMAPLISEVSGVSEAFKKANASLRKSVPAFTERMDSASAEFQRNQTALKILSDVTNQTKASMTDLSISVSSVKHEIDSAVSARVEVLELITRAMNTVGDTASTAVREAFANADWRQVVSITVEQEKLAQQLQGLGDRVEVLQRQNAETLNICVKEMRLIKEAINAPPKIAESSEVSSQEALRLLREMRDLIAAAETKRRWPW